MKGNIFIRIKEGIEKIIPMTFGSLFLFVFIIYLLIVVGRSVWNNHQADQKIEAQMATLDDLRAQIKLLENQNNYYQTYSFKEKEAREKLGYKLPGESIMALPIDTETEKLADSGLADAKPKTPNPILWWRFFTQ